MFLNYINNFFSEYVPKTVIAGSYDNCILVFGEASIFSIVKIWLHQFMFT